MLLILIFTLLMIVAFPRSSRRGRRAHGPLARERRSLRVKDVLYACGHVWERAWAAVGGGVRPSGAGGGGHVYGERARVYDDILSQVWKHSINI